MDQNRFVPTLEDMSDTLMSLVKSLCVDAVEMAHALREIAVRGFYQKMIVIAH